LQGSFADAQVFYFSITLPLAYLHPTQHVSAHERSSPQDFINPQPLMHIPGFVLQSNFTLL
jgi:hypothetical protein